MSPKLFGPIGRRLSEIGVIEGTSRVVLEKPIGEDLASARSINAMVGEVFDEHQISRGKELRPGHRARA